MDVETHEWYGEDRLWQHKSATLEAHVRIAALTPPHSIRWLRPELRVSLYLLTPKNIASLALAAIMVTPAARDGAVHAQALSPVAFFERLVLSHFYHATNGPDWTDDANWLTDAPVGEWHGVAVDEEGRVTGLRLDANRLTGAIPPALANLAKLESLSLGLNQLSGEIPSELAGLTELTWLGLHGNRLSGSIPPELVRLSSLTSLWLSDNQLSGSIPPDLDRLTALRELVLSRNRLSGEVPPSLGNLANLQRLALGGNRLRGSIPPELANLANLTRLNLSRNQLSGEVLPSLGVRYARSYSGGGGQGA